jgi:hypothetical protein
MVLQHDVTLADKQREQLEGLSAEWKRFQDGLSAAVGTLEQAKDAFKEKVKGLVEAFNEEVVLITQSFMSSAPFSHKGHTTQQVDFLVPHRSHVNFICMYTVDYSISCADRVSTKLSRLLARLRYTV